MKLEKVDREADLKLSQAQTPGSQRAKNVDGMDRQRQRELKRQISGLKQSIYIHDSQVLAMYMCPEGQHKGADAGGAACHCITRVLERLREDDPRPGLERAVEESQEIQDAVSRLMIAKDGGEAFQERKARLEEMIPGMRLSLSNGPESDRGREVMGSPV
jgi:hypothetical protein